MATIGGRHCSVPGTAATISVSHAPPNYGTGRPHIHIKVSSDGYKTLITQHYPAENAGEGMFNLVLVPN